MAQKQSIGSTGEGPMRAPAVPTETGGGNQQRRWFDFSRFMPSRVGRSAQQGDKSASNPPGMASRMGRFLLGFLIFIVIGQYVIPLLLTFLDDQLGHSLQSRISSDHNTPLFGGLTWFLAIYLLLVVALYIALIRFKIIPTDPFGNRARMEAERQARLNATSTGSAGARARTRASRRAVESGGGGTAKGGAGKGGTKAGVAASQSSARQPVPKARESGAHDDAYERVRAAQRLARRRAARR